MAPKGDDKQRAAEKKAAAAKKAKARGGRAPRRAGRLGRRLAFSRSPRALARGVRAPPDASAGRAQAAEDKTFGLKNKNKSVKVQKCAPGAAASVARAPAKTPACARGSAPARR
jgi:hypothetical protein